MKSKRFVAFVLDRSGSMEKIKEEAVEGLNDQMNLLRAEAEKGGSECLFSLTVFSTDVESLYFNESINSLQNLTYDKYVPNGWTHLYDGVGYTIDRLCSETDVDNEYNSYLVIVVSDGQETPQNGSKVWTAASLAKKIKSLQDTNRWTFAYVGANQDLSTNVVRMSGGSSIAFAASKSGMRRAQHTNSVQMAKWLDNSREKSYATNDFYEGASDVSDAKFDNANAALEENKVEVVKNGPPKVGCVVDIPKNSGIITPHILKGKPLPKQMPGFGALPPIKPKTPKNGLSSEEMQKFFSTKK